MTSGTHTRPTGERASASPSTTTPPTPSADVVAVAASCAHLFTTTFPAEEHDSIVREKARTMIARMLPQWRGVIRHTVFGVFKSSAGTLRREQNTAHHLRMLVYDRLLAWPIIGLIGPADHGKPITD